MCMILNLRAQGRHADGTTQPASKYFKGENQANQQLNEIWSNLYNTWETSFKFRILVFIVRHLGPCMQPDHPEGYNEKIVLP